MPLSSHAALNKDRSKPSVIFQHRHFAKIAEIISDISDETERYRFAMYFANKLSTTNSNFDRERFIRACTEEK